MSGRFLPLRSARFSIPLQAFADSSYFESAVGSNISDSSIGFATLGCSLKFRVKQNPWCSKSAEVSQHTESFSPLRQTEVLRIVQPPGNASVFQDDASAVWPPPLKSRNANVFFDDLGDLFEDAAEVFAFEGLSVSVFS